MIKTNICDIFDIKYPIFQGGMAWISEATLAAAVSNAGGVGFISAMNAGVPYVREQIRKCRALTDKPFGVNIMLMSPYALDIAKLVIEEGVKIVTTGAGLPASYMPDWLAAGIKVVPVVPSTAIARRVEKFGATAVIAEGGESGGHVGELTTITLVPQVVDAVSIPVIAAGGIGDGRGIAAAFMLGATGVQCGTRFLTATECQVHENYKKKILEAKDIDTIVTGKTLGHPVRTLKNAFARSYAEKEQSGNVPKEELEKLGAGALRNAAVDGDVAQGSIMAGQIAAMVRDELPAKDIIERMFEEAEKRLEGASLCLV
ncbi:2-nitropropane dioxygenase [Clostridia bacterium]|nr:2-nitropropane dioxygenase [Clostridia bacterium]